MRGQQRTYDGFDALATRLLDILSKPLCKNQDKVPESQLQKLRQVLIGSYIEACIADTFYNVFHKSGSHFFEFNDTDEACNDCTEQKFEVFRKELVNTMKFAAEHAAEIAAKVADDIKNT